MGVTPPSGSTKGIGLGEVVDHSEFLLKSTPRGADLGNVEIPAPDRQSAPRLVVPLEPLHVCPRCDSELVHPVGWSEAGAGRWHLELQCPNCTWLGGGEFDQELVDELEDQLDLGTKALVRDLRRLVRANMEDEIERFVKALAADAILPMDF
jgi:hypothetical protein